LITECYNIYWVVVNRYGPDTKGQITNANKQQAY